MALLPGGTLLDILLVLARMTTMYLFVQLLSFMLILSFHGLWDFRVCF